MYSLVKSLLKREYRKSPIPPSLIAFILLDGNSVWFCKDHHRVEIYLSDDKTTLHVNDGGGVIKNIPSPNESVLLFTISQFAGTVLDEVLNPPTPYSFPNLLNYPGVSKMFDHEMLQHVYLSRLP